MSFGEVCISDILSGLARGWSQHCIFLFVLCALMASVTVLTGNLCTGPRLVDDVQVYELHDEISRKGVFPTLKRQIDTRTNKGRYVVVFLFEKVAKSCLYGINLKLWKVHVAILGTLAGLFLYAFAFQVGHTRFEAALFSLVIITGPQSVAWVRLIHGEGLGLVFFSLALLLLPLRVRNHRHPWLFDLGILACLALASLSKESFLLTIPAVIFLRCMLISRQPGQSLWLSFKNSKVVLSLLGGAGVLLIFSASTLIDHFRRWYVGWNEFEFERLRHTLTEFVDSLTIWPITALFGLLIAAALWLHPERSTLRSVGRQLMLYGVCAAAHVIPQILLYYKLGFSSDHHPTLSLPRYLLPMIVGYALILVVLLRSFRKLRSGTAIRRMSLAWGVLVLIPMVLASLLFLNQLTKAFDENSRFAQRTESENRVLDLIKFDAQTRDPILLVYDEQDGSFRRRMGTLLRYYLNRHNLLFYPIKTGSSLPLKRAGEIRANTRQRLEESGSLPRVVLLQNKKKISAIFHAQTKDWFPLEDFHDYQSKNLTEVRILTQTHRQATTLPRFLGSPSDSRGECQPLD